MTAIAVPATEAPDEVRLIPIEAGHVAIVNAADYEWVARYNWLLLRGHNGKFYAHASVTGGSLYMHRLIAETPAGYETDHINGNGLDNRRANLRIATPSQNSANMWKPQRPDGRPRTSIYKGVHWAKGSRKWVAKIEVSGCSKYLGSFTVEADAARAYDAAAEAAWGDFARLNFPRGGEVAA
jgi:hypothetical protein